MNLWGGRKAGGCSPCCCDNKERPWIHPFLPSVLYMGRKDVASVFLSLLMIRITDRFNFLADPCNFSKVFRVIKLCFMVTGNAILPSGTCLGVGIVNIKVCIHFDIKVGSEGLIALRCAQFFHIRESLVLNCNFIHQTLSSEFNHVITLHWIL